MSGYRADILDENEIPYEAIVDEHPDHLIVKVPAALVRELGLGLVPVVEEGPIGAAHLHFTGKKTEGRQRRLVRASEWVKGPS